MKQMSSKDYRLNEIFNSPTKKAWRNKQNYKIEKRWVWDDWREVKVYDSSYFRYDEGITVLPTCKHTGAVNVPFDYLDNGPSRQTEVTEKERKLRLVHI